MAKVLIYRGDTLEHDFDPGERDWRIGRGTGNDIVLADPSKSVSRFHAELRFEQGQWHLIDLNSQNGTWVDGQRIQRQVLTPGASVLFGEYRLVFEAPQPAVEAAAAPADAEDPSTAKLPHADPLEKMDTLIGGAAASTPAASAPAAPPAAARPAAPARPAPAARATAATRPARRPRGDGGGGIVLWLVQRKALTFAMFLFICMFIIFLGRVLRPSPAAPRRPAQAQQGTTTPAQDSNQAAIATHLKAGRAQMDAGRCDVAIRDHFERILLIDSTNSEATELKARCEQILATLQSQGATPPGTTTPGSATSGPGATSTAPSGTTAGPGASTGATSGTTGTTGTATGTTASTGTTTGTTTPGGTTSSSSRGSRTRATDATRAANISANRYATARAALAKGDFAGVRAAATAILQQSPGDAQAQALLDQAKVGLHEVATREVEAAKRAESEGEWEEAVRRYERARDAEPTLAGVANALTNAREKRRQAGEDAYNKARQYHSLGRVPEAIAWYERAVKWLPADDARRQTAETRLAELKKQ
jgi:tetratricopeptide (TPR) repeat protein